MSDKKRNFFSLKCKKNQIHSWTSSSPNIGKSKINCPWKFKHSTRQRDKSSVIQLQIPRNAVFSPICNPNGDSNKSAISLVPDICNSWKLLHFPYLGFTRTKLWYHLIMDWSKTEVWREFNKELNFFRSEVGGLGNGAINNKVEKMRNVTTLCVHYIWS